MTMIELRFAFMGFLGGIAYILVWKIVDKYEIARHTILGAIVGYVYHFLHTEYTYPNLIMAFVSGYFSVDFIEGLIARVRGKEV